MRFIRSIVSMVLGILFLTHGIASAGVLTDRQYLSDYELPCCGGSPPRSMSSGGAGIHRVACRAEEEVTPAIIFDNESEIFSVIFASYNRTLDLYVKQFSSNFMPVLMRQPSQPPSPPVDVWQVKLTDDEHQNALPSVIFENDTYYMAYSADSNQIFVNLYNITWHNLSQYQITTDTTLLENDPSLLYYNDSFYIAYESFEEENWHIFIRKYNSSFGLQQKSLLTYSPNGEQMPSLTIYNDMFYLAYSSYYKNDDFASIFVDEYNLNFTLKRTIRVTNESHSIQPSIYYYNNTFYVDYAVYEEGHYNIVFEEYDQDFDYVKEVQITGTPADEVSPGVINASDNLYHIYATDESGSNDIFVTVGSEDCVLPDLTVESVDYDEDKIEGEILTLNVSVKNVGFADAEDVNVSFYIDETWHDSFVFDMPKTTETNVLFDYTVLNGLHDLKIIIDPENITKEEFYDNNEKSISYWALNISLLTGENLISIPVTMKQDSTEHVLKSINDSLNITFAYLANDQMDPWKSYDPVAPEFANDLENITNSMGLWINVTQDDILQVGGLLDEKPYDLKIGWNLVGYPFNTTRSVTDVQNESVLRHHNYTVIYEYNASLGYERFYDESNESSNLLTMSPGLGYWIYVPDSDEDYLSDGEEVYEYYREIFLESEDFDKINADFSVHLGDGVGGFAWDRDYPVGDGSSDIVAGDFNGDTNLDIAISNFRGNDISILFGNDTGGFTWQQNYPVGNGPSDLVTGRFNNYDTYLDLAVVNYYDDTVSIFLGNETGGFTWHQNCSVGDGPSSIVFEDFNQDLFLDLAITNSLDNTISILLGNGNGGFTWYIDRPVGDGPSSIVTGEFNPDTFPDLAVTNYESNDVSILFGDGAGGFNPSQNIVVGDGPSGIVAGDFFNYPFGYIDLAITNYGSDDICLLHNDYGYFYLEQSYFVGDGPTNTITSDFNDDYIYDLAVSNFYSDTISVLLGDDYYGGFHLDQSYYVGDGPSDLVAGHFNMDANLDFAVANNNDVDRYQFGTSLHSRLPQNRPSYTLNFNIVKDNQYRVTTSGTGEVKFFYNIVDEPLCDFDYQEFAREAMLELINVSVFKDGEEIDPLTEEKTWVHLVTSSEMKEKFTDYGRFITVASYWMYTGEFEFDTGLHKLNMSCDPIPQNQGQQSWWWLVESVTINNSYFRIERQGLDRFDNDTDDDSILDGVEFISSFYPLSKDPDKDGLSDPTEFYTTNTNGEFRDSDFDGVRDSVEIGRNGSDVDPYTTYDTLPENIDADPGNTTDPLNPDTDGDGLPDGWRDGWGYPIAYGYDTIGEGWQVVGVADNVLNVPLQIHDRIEGEDFDGDGKVNAGLWKNGIFFGSGETDPLDNDTDDDTLPDAWEVYWRIDPLQSISPHGPDDDADVLYFDEINETPDPDGLRNLDEFIVRTNPRSSDSDNDGLNDSIEVTEVVLRTNISEGTRGIDHYGEINASGSEEWIWFKGKKYIFDRLETPSSLNFQVLQNGFNKFLYIRDIRNTTVIALLEDNSLVSLNISSNEISVCKKECYIYRYVGVEAQNTSPQLSFKNRELYTTDPINIDTDADTILDSEEPYGDNDSDGLVNARDYDSDGDTIPDFIENTIWTNRLRYFISTDTDGDGKLNMIDLDSDADGIPDQDENPMVVHITSYVDPDSDDDGLLDGNNITVSTNHGDPDYYKLVFFLSHDISYTNNTHNETFTFWGENPQGTLPNDADTDDDLLYDGFNRMIEIMNESRISHHGELSYNCKPLVNDTDEDEILDGWEVYGWPVFVEDVGGNRRSFKAFSDPTKKDTDGDYVNDTFEYLKTDGNSTDTDDDGLVDGMEDTNYNGVLDTGETSPVDIDSDDDYLPDGKRDMNNNSNFDLGEYEDRDCDGILDPGESNPLDADTDNDGLIDGFEARVVRFRTNVDDGNYSKIGSWVALDVGEDVMATFVAATYNHSKYEPYVKLDFQTPEGYDIYYNSTQPEWKLYIKSPDENYTMNRTFNVQHTPTPKGEYGEREVYFTIGSWANNTDTDNDGLSDGVEFYNLSSFNEHYLIYFNPDDDGYINIIDNDSDNDFINDSNDLWHTTNHTLCPKYTQGCEDYWEPFWYNDFDGDGYKNALDNDSDNDGTNDGAEDTNHSGLYDQGDASNPLSNDSDDDGITDNIEDSVGLNKSNPDTDFDGIIDGKEGGGDWNNSLDNDSYINPLDPDADGDGLLDGINITIDDSDHRFDSFMENHTSYIIEDENYTFLGEGSYGTDPWDPDTDHDGLWDGFNPYDVGNKTYSGKLTIGSITFDIEGLKGSNYYNEIISTLPLEILGEMAYGTSPLNNDSDEDGITDGDELNGYFLFDVPFECERYDNKIELFINTPGDYIISFETESLYLHIAGKRSFNANVKDIDDNTVYSYYKLFEPRIFFPETEFYPYEPGQSTENGIASIYHHDVPLNNLSAGPKTVYFSSPDANIGSTVDLLLRGGLDPANKDTDNDTIIDGQEVFGTKTISIPSMGGLQTGVKTIATKQDSDEDGLNDSADPLPVDIAGRENVDIDLDGVWDDIDLQPNTVVDMDWKTFHQEQMVFYNATYRIWGIKGEGCGDIPPWEPLKRAELIDCPCRFNTGDGCWKIQQGFHKSDINDESVKKAIKEQIVVEDPYVITSLSFRSKRDPPEPSVAFPYYVKNDLTYYPAWKLFFELPDYLYNASIENEKPVEVKVDDFPFIYDLEDVIISPDRYQEFVIQFALYNDYFFYFDSDNFNIPAISFTLYDDQGVAKENVVQRGMALAQPLESPTCKNAYNARIKIPREYALQESMQLYISPMWILKQNGDVQKTPISRTQIIVGSLSKQTLDYAYSVITHNQTNLSQIVNATPDNIQTYSSGPYAFNDSEFYIYHHNGSHDIDYNEVNTINTNLIDLDAVVIISDAHGMVEAITSRIDWTDDWYMEDNATIKVYRQYKKQQKRIVTFDDFSAIGDTYTIIGDEPDMDEASGEVASQTRRLNDFPVDASYEVGFSIKKKENVEVDSSSNKIGMYLSTAKDFIDYGLKIKNLTMKVIEAGEDDKWYKGVLKYKDEIEAVSDKVELAGDLIGFGACLATDGVSAYVAFKEGDYVEATLYSIKVGVEGIETVDSVYDKVKVTKKVEIDSATKASKNLVQKTEVSKKARGLKAGVKKQVILTIVVGVVDIALAYKEAKEADDVIAQSFALEAMAAATIDLALGIAGDLFWPILVITTTFDLATEAFSRISPCKSRLACNLGKKSLSEKIVFWVQVHKGIIPTDIYQEGYMYAQITLFGGEYESASAVGLINTYSDEGYLEYINEKYYAQAIIMPEPEEI